MTRPGISLFEGELVRLAARDPERDAGVEAEWTLDPEFSHLMETTPARPLSPGQIKKRWAEEEKEKNAFTFAIRTRSGDRLVGFAALKWVQWAHGVATLSIGIGSPADRGHGYGTEALDLVLRYAFSELNLYRVGAVNFEYNPRALGWLERAGFVVEVQRREAVHRDGRRWNIVHLGLLRDEWKGTP